MGMDIAVPPGILQCPSHRSFSALHLIHNKSGIKHIKKLILNIGIEITDSKSQLPSKMQIL